MKDFTDEIEEISPDRLESIEKGLSRLITYNEKYYTFLEGLGTIISVPGFHNSINELNRFIEGNSTLNNNLMESVEINFGDLQTLEEIELFYSMHDNHPKVEQVYQSFSEILVTEGVAIRAIESVFCPLDKLIDSNQISSWVLWNDKTIANLAEVIPATRNVISHCHEKDDFHKGTVKPLRDLLTNSLNDLDNEFNSKLIEDFFNFKNNKDSWKISLYVFESLGIKDYMDILNISHRDNLEFNRE